MRQTVRQLDAELDAYAAVTADQSSSPPNATDPTVLCDKHIAAIEMMRKTTACCTDIHRRFAASSAAIVAAVRPSADQRTNLSPQWMAECQRRLTQQRDRIAADWERIERTAVGGRTTMQRTDEYQRMSLVLQERTVNHERAKRLTDNLLRYRHDEQQLSESNGVLDRFAGWTEAEVRAAQCGQPIELHLDSFCSKSREAPNSIAPSTATSY